MSGERYRCLSNLPRHGFIQMLGIVLYPLLLNKPAKPLLWNRSSFLNCSRGTISHNYSTPLFSLWLRGGDPLDWVKVILGSKRAQAAIVALIIGAFGKYGLHLSEVEVASIVAAISAWIVGDSLRPTIGATNAKA